MTHPTRRVGLMGKGKSGPRERANSPSSREPWVRTKSPVEEVRGVVTEVRADRLGLGQSLGAPKILATGSIGEYDMIASFTDGCIEELGNCDYGGSRHLKLRKFSL